jgi:hypothetical protein
MEDYGGKADADEMKNVNKEFNDNRYVNVVVYVFAWRSIGCLEWSWPVAPSRCSVPSFKLQSYFH